MTSLPKGVNKNTRPELQQEWDRQLHTAGHIISRFNDGHDVQLLADEVGMGKTYVALAVMADQLQGEKPRALLITPSSAVLRDKWEREIRSFSSEYLGKDARAMRPLVVDNYWDLLANLHDYANQKNIRVTADRQRCVLAASWSWWKQRQRKLRSGDGGNLMRWPALRDDPPTEAEQIRFSEEFSVAAWHAYLEHHNSTGGEIAADMGRGGGLSGQEPERALNRLNRTFRAFASWQDAYEPNVLIISMGDLSKIRTERSRARQYTAFLLSEVLRNQRDATRTDVLKRLKKTTLLPDGLTLKGLAVFDDLDLYRTRAAVQERLASDAALASQRRALLASKLDKPGAFFRQLTREVVAQKLSASDMQLAVVDEVHNWKGAKNGAKEFREGFARCFIRKLVMSATPFQLQQGEMLQVFTNVVTPQGKSWQVVQELCTSGAVDRCIQANGEFQQAWEALSQNTIACEVLADAFEHAEDVADALQLLVSGNDTDGILARFGSAAIAYRARVQALTELQSRLMVRHLKRNPRRNVHAGQDFGQPISRPRPTLYGTPGLVRDEDQLVNFLAMRLNQMVRQAGNTSDRAKAHLMGGLTSSVAAFKASVHGERSVRKDLPPHVLGYAEMFEKVLATHSHPKVAATVAHALENYRRGRKSLIFCDRIATVREISDLLVQNINKVVGGDARAGDRVRAQVLKQEAFVDLPLAWLVSGSQVPAHQVAQPDAATAFAARVLRQAGGEPTQRRILRLLNIFLLARSAKPAALGGLCREFVALLDHAQPADNAFLRDILGMQAGSEIWTGDVEARVSSTLDQMLRPGRNLWLDGDTPDFGTALGELLDSEARRVPVDAGDQVRDEDQARHRKTQLAAFMRLWVTLESGLKRVLLRADVIARLDTKVADLAEEVHRCVRMPLAADGRGESAWQRMGRFVRQLAMADGSINLDDQTTTKRRSLWRAVSLRGVSREAENGGGSEALVRTISSAISNPADRIAICEGFNSPLSPDILICTSIGSEGIDLHQECAEVIHHDMPWNPARLEQRNGRVDRVGSYSEATRTPIRLGIPFLEQGYERFQYDTLLRRAQRFEVLLGTPEFEVTEGDLEGLEDKVDEVNLEAEAAATPMAAAVLPEALVRWLAVDLSVWAPPPEPA